MAILTNTEVNAGLQFGLETTEGTAVAASKLIPDAKVTPGWERTSTVYTASAYKFPTMIVDGKQWSTFAVTSPIGYASVWYYLSSGGNYAAPTGTTAKAWANTPGVTGTNTSKTYTIEWGVAAAAFRAVGAHVVGVTFHFDRENPSMTANFIAKRIEVGVTLTASPTTIENVPVTGPQVQIGTAATFAGLSSATALDHAYVLDVTFGNLYNQEWPLKRANTSWGDRYETYPNATATLTALEQLSGTDFTGTPLSKADMDAGVLNFIRADAIGALISGSDYYTFGINMAVLIGPGGPTPSFMDGLKVNAWPLQIATDPTSNKAIAFDGINTLAGL